MSEEIIDGELSEPSTALTVIDAELTCRRSPNEVLDEATRAAQAIKRVLDGKSRPVKFNGETYLENEDWQTIGRFYGLTAKVLSCERVELDGVFGYEVWAAAVTSDIREVSRACSACYSDEQNWRGKPRFQIQSMAQTRACAKVLRNVLGFVPVLAGFRPTPAEEIDNLTAPNPSNGGGKGFGVVNDSGVKCAECNAPDKARHLGSCSANKVAA